MLIGLLLALGCSVCYGTATVLQAAATRSVDAGDSDSGVDAALLLRALRQWRYLVGIGLDGLGFVLQVAALRLVPIYVVAAAIAGVVGRHRDRGGMGAVHTVVRVEWAAVAVVCGEPGDARPCRRPGGVPGTVRQGWAGRCW